MEGRTDVNQYTPPLFSKRGYKYIIIILHTDYDHSSLHTFTEIFTEFQYLKYGKKENWTNTGNNKYETAGSKSYDTIHHYPNMTTLVCTVSQKSLTKNFII